MKEPIISVLIPTYNYARFLNEALDSVLAQDFEDIEVIVRDDSSADDSAAIARGAASRDRRVRAAVNESNIGMVNNWNCCLAEARGRHVKFLFGDDRLSQPHALRKLHESLEKHPGATLASSGREIIDENSRLIDLWQPLKEGLLDGRETVARCVTAQANLIGEPSTVMFRKSDAARGFDGKLAQVVDMEMWFSMLEKGGLTYTREPLSAFRLHSRQQTALNLASGAAEIELLGLLADYAGRSWMPWRARAAAFFALRRACRRRGVEMPPALKDATAELGRKLGWTYGLWWLGRKLWRPAQNLRHAWQKSAKSAQLAAATQGRWRPAAS